MSACRPEPNPRRVGKRLRRPAVPEDVPVGARVTEHVRLPVRGTHTGTATDEGTSNRGNDRQAHLRYFNRDGLPTAVLKGHGLITQARGRPQARRTSQREAWVRLPLPLQIASEEVVSVATPAERPSSLLEESAAMFDPGPGTWSFRKQPRSRAGCRSGHMAHQPRRKS